VVSIVVVSRSFLMIDGYRCDPAVPIPKVFAIPVTDRDALNFAANGHAAGPYTDSDFSAPQESRCRCRSRRPQRLRT